MTIYCFYLSLVFFFSARGNWLIFCIGLNQRFFIWLPVKADEQIFCNKMPYVQQEATFLPILPNSLSIHFTKCGICQWIMWILWIGWNWIWLTDFCLEISDKSFIECVLSVAATQFWRARGWGRQAGASMGGGGAANGDKHKIWSPQNDFCVWGGGGGGKCLHVPPPPSTTTTDFWIGGS